MRRLRFLWGLIAARVGGVGVFGGARGLGGGIAPVPTNEPSVERPGGLEGAPGLWDPVERTAADLGGEQLAAPSAAADAAWTRYRWRLVDRFGVPVGQVMVEGAFLGPDEEVLQSVQEYIDLRGAPSNEILSWDEQPPYRLRLETGEQGRLPVDLALPAPVVGGVTDLGDLAVPTIAGQFGSALISGRVLNADGSLVQGLIASGGVGMGDHEAWREAGGCVVEVDPHTGAFELFGPGHLVDSVYVSFQAPGRTSEHRDMVPLGSHGMEFTMGVAQVVRLSFSVPGGQGPGGHGFDFQFWSTELLSRSRGYVGQQNFKRPPAADSLRIVDPLTGIVLHRFDLPEPDGAPLELEHVDLGETVNSIKIRLLDGGGEQLDHPSVHLERPGESPTLRVAQGGVLKFYAPKAGGLLHVSLAPGGHRVEPVLTVDLAAPPLSLQFP